MNDCILLQQAHGPFEELLNASYADHKGYCKRHKIDYLAMFGRYPVSENRHSQWFKVQLIIDALKAGYRYAVWLDADALVVSDISVRNGVPRDAIGACWHTNNQWSRPNEYDHFNCGALYVPNTEYVQHFLKMWLHESDEGHHWFEQHAFNMAYRCVTPAVKRISHRWNSVPNVYEDGEPVVKAWHGCFDVAYRLEQMKHELEVLHSSEKDDIIACIT